MEGESPASAREVASDPTRCPSLPPTIDPTVAVGSIRRQRGLLLNLIRHCLLEVTNSLFGECMITQAVYEVACNENKAPGERGVALLDCVEARVEVVPSDFTKVVHILEAEPFLRSQAEDLIKSYCTISSATTTTLSCPPLPSSSAISHYRAYLKIVYNRSSISPHAKWPPTPSREYISLAVVEGGHTCRDEYIGHTLRGNVKEILKSRHPISMEQILEGQSTLVKVHWG